MVVYLQDKLGAIWCCPGRNIDSKQLIDRRFYVTILISFDCQTVCPVSRKQAKRQHGHGPRRFNEYAFNNSL